MGSVGHPPYCDFELPVKPRLVFQYRMATKASKGDTADKSQSLTTAIHLPRRTWELLREVAFSRARKRGGRSSVSKVLVELTESARPNLEKEI